MKQVITHGLPQGFCIEMEHLESAPRHFELKKNDVVIAAGREFGIGSSGEYSVQYYAATDRKAVDDLMDKFRTSNAEKREADRKKFLADCEERAAERRIAADKAMADGK